MKRVIVSLFTVSILLFGITSSFGQTVSDEAKRHFNRGVAAVEMAKSAADYEAAIKEFKQAIDLAPDWADAYYNLGKVQEQAEKFADAIASFRQYLRLAPNASDAETAKSLIDKLEYKAENTLTKADIISVVTSFSKWKVTEGPEWTPYFFSRITSKDEGLINVPTCEGQSPCSRASYQTLKVEGPTVKYRWAFYQLPPHDIDCHGDCTSIWEIEIEVLSKTRVKIRRVIVSFTGVQLATPLRTEWELSAPK